MSDDLQTRISRNPKFAELVSKRTSYGWMLSIIMLVVYYAFIMVVAFWPADFGKPIAVGMVTTWGFPVGIGVILIAIGITGLYVRRANSEFDDLTRQILEEAK